MSIPELGILFLNVFTFALVLLQTLNLLPQILTLPLLLLKIIFELVESVCLFQKLLLSILHLFDELLV